MQNFEKVSSGSDSQKSCPKKKKKTDTPIFFFFREQAGSRRIAKYEKPFMTAADMFYDIG